MSLSSTEDPPPPGNIHVPKPPPSDRPTTAMLKADINSGATGDKIAAYDPGLSQLGTDDEAAGNAPSAGRVAMARKSEAAPAKAQRAARAESSNAWVTVAYGTAISAIGLILALSIWLAR